MFFFFFENCQNEEDAAVLEKSGFSRITVLPLTRLKVGNVKITRIPAQHGTYKNCGEAMGVMFSAETEKTFYLAGDTVWYYGVQKAINEFKPEVIALNCCAAETKENGRLIMGAEDVWNVSLAAPEAKLYLTHMDNVAHASVTRFTMRGQLTAYGVSNYDILEDGGSVVY